jgi:hypothetical protein
MSERIDVTAKWSPDSISGDTDSADTAGSEMGKTPVTLPVDDVELDVAFSTCKRLAMEILRGGGVHDAQLLGPYVTRLNGTLKEELAELRTANKSASKSFCSALIEYLTEPSWERAREDLRESTENQGFGLELGLMNLKVGPGYY